ncbi:MAG: hypothetical protein B9S30_05555 [Verrucomicrobiia bacterium Tous-C5FEB]|jgi:ElaB/YqjD/DUF883 family membrane-anchored ribosome-binding protein|nr:MAG: hypothetical protein B9S30_05555 [Verrucomicrobiae bacterium Tous-C5FEB]
MVKTKTKKVGSKKSAGKERHHLQEVIAHAEELLESTAGELGERAREVRQQLVQKIAAAKERFEDFDDVKEAAEEGMKEADRMIRKHPYESVGVALVAGLLIGALLSRR